MDNIEKIILENINLEDGIFITDLEGKIIFPFQAKGKSITQFYPFKEIFDILEDKNKNLENNFVIKTSINVFRIYVKKYKNYIFFKVKDITKDDYLENIINLLFSSFIHEIKSPLTNILGYLELIDVPENFQEILERNKNRLLKLLEKSKTFAKLYNYSLNYKLINLKEFIKNILENYYPQIKEKKLDLFFKVNDVKIKTDPFLLEIIISNLLSNAINATEKGYILVYLEEKKKEYILGIKDSGSGISSSIRKRMFDPFFSTKGSLGLGLFLVRKACEYLNYKIEIETPSLGTCFKIIIPKS